MKIEELEQVFILMKKHDVSSLALDGEIVTIKMRDDYEKEMSPEIKEALEKLEKSENVSDEDILYDPYAGLEINNE